MLSIRGQSNRLLCEEKCESKMTKGSAWALIPIQQHVGNYMPIGACDQTAFLTVMPLHPANLHGEIIWNGQRRAHVSCGIKASIPCGLKDTMQILKRTEIDMSESISNR